MMVFLNPVLFAREGDREALVAEELVRMSGDERARDHQGMDLFDWTTESFVGGGPNTIMGCGVLSQLEPVFRRPEGSHERLYFTAAAYALDLVHARPPMRSRASAATCARAPPHSECQHIRPRPR